MPCYSKPLQLKSLLSLQKVQKVFLFQVEKMAKYILPSCAYYLDKELDEEFSFYF